MASFGEDFVRLLHAHGITHAFGIPGVHTVELYRGLPGSGIAHVTPRHEQGAGFMAYGYALATGRPAACFLITGPGLANAATALGEARSESVPVLVVATNNERRHLGLDSGYLHATKSQIGIAEQVVDFAHQLLDQDNAESIVGKIFSRFRAMRPGPAYLEIPLDLLSQDSRLTGDVWPSAAAPAPSQESLQEAAKLLAKAERPIVIVGGGCMNAASEVLAFAEAMDCPVVTTTSGKGVLSEDHALSLGAALPFSPVQDYIKHADVVLAVGTELAETDTLYTYSRYEIDGTLIRIDIDPERLSTNYRPSLPIVGDAKQALPALQALLAPLGELPVREDGADVVSTLRAQLEGEWIPGAEAHKRVLDILRSVLEEDAVLATEECQLGYTANQYFPCFKPRTYIHPTGYGTLGPALPAAIGAKVGLPDRQVVAIVGDGSFLFTAGEMAAAAELGISLPIIVWNSGGYTEIANYMDKFDIERLGVDLSTPDFAKLAEGFNCVGKRPDNASAFEADLREALETTQPTVIELRDNDAWLQ